MAQDEDMWIAALQAGETVVVESPNREVLETSHGVELSRLSAVERLRGEQILEAVIAQHRESLWETNAAGSGAAARSAAADLEHRIVMLEEALLAFRKDEFVILPRGESLNVSGADAKVVNLLPVVVDGERMRLWVVLKYSEHPSLLAARQYRRDIGAWVETALVREFNEKPLGERKRLFEEHAAWEARQAAFEEAKRAALEGGGGLFSAMRNDSDLVSLLQEVGSPVLPAHGGKDTVAYLLSPPRRE